MRKTYAFNGTDATELSLEILFRSLVGKTTDHQGLEGIAADVWVFRGLV